MDFCVYIRCEYTFEPAAREQLRKLLQVDLSDDGVRHVSTWHCADHWLSTADWPVDHYTWTVSVSEIQWVVTWQSLLGVWSHYVPHSHFPSSLGLWSHYFRHKHSADEIRQSTARSVCWLVVTDKILSTTISPLLVDETSHVVVCHELHVTSLISRRPWRHTTSRASGSLAGLR